MGKKTGIKPGDITKGRKGVDEGIEQVAITLDSLVDCVENQGKETGRNTTTLVGSPGQPGSGLVSRVDTLEERSRGSKWLMGLLFSALATGSIALIITLVGMVGG